MAFAAAAQILLAAATLSPSPGYLPKLIEQARSAGLAESRQWQTLMHYRRRTLGGWQSEADGAGFFLAGPRGRRDPAAELEASLAAFLAPGPLGDAHAQCRFPARWEWLKQALAIDQEQEPWEGSRTLPRGTPLGEAQLRPRDRPRVPYHDCPALHQWFTGISPQAATLVYATAYINSPASIYGHTFLRVSRSTGEGNPLLDYAINFAADVDTENGVLYAMKGIFGLFPGRFYVLPYYVKVQEYSNMESRDLWEYELSLSSEQVRRMVLHAWETRNTYFNYYFFSRNCSYQLLSLIEVAAPDLHLVDRFGPAVIPSDTVRAVLSQPGLVRAERPRPSLLSVLRRRRVGLSSRELRVAEIWATAPDGAVLPPLPPVSRERQAQILDAAYDYLRYHEGLKAEPSEAFKKRERRLLLARGRLGVPPQDPVAVPDVDAPERGHATARVSLGGGTSDQAGPFQTLSIRGAIHDTLDPPAGYPVDARLQMGDLRLRFVDRQHTLQLDRLDLIDIVSSAPLDRWVRGVSWKVWFGVDNARELGCARPDSPDNGWRCLYAGVTTGGGLATRFGPRRRLLLLALAETDLGAGPAFSSAHDFRLGAGGEVMLAGGTGDRWRFEVGSRLIFYFLGERTPNLRARFGEAVLLSPHVALRAGVETANAYAQVTGELLAYF